MKEAKKYNPLVVTNKHKAKFKAKPLPKTKTKTKFKPRTKLEARFPSLENKMKLGIIYAEGFVKTSRK